MTRTGVFLCTCDGKIEEKIQVSAFPFVMRIYPEIALVQPMPNACSSAGVAALENAIRQQHLDHVVVAACPARFQEKRLRRACADAGVNPNHFAWVDWREGCVDAHDASRQILTGKAIDLVQMAVARVSRAQPVEPIRADIEPRVLVIGGGIAGMTAARSIADHGIRVTLVERAAALGGQLRDIPLDGAAQVYEQTRGAVLAHPNIDVRLDARVVAADGSVGKHRVQIADSFGVSELDVGAIVVATGAQEYRAATLPGYDGRRVTTLGEFESQLPHLATPASIVYILCAGSRNAPIPYCSKVCCLGALNQATRVKRAHPAARVSVLFRDFYLLGDAANEEVVLHARRAGVDFARYNPAHPPRVSRDFVEMCDAGTGAARQIAYDRVVLATPLVPHADAGALARLLDLPRDETGFFVDPHYRVHSDQSIDRGIFVCGSAHAPVDMDTAILQGLTAAARATRFIQQRVVSRPAWAASVDPQLCTGCAQCVETCAFGAIKMTAPTLTRSRVAGEGEFDRASIDPLLCQACGNCVVACPAKAIDALNASDAQIFAQIDAALAARGDGVAPVLVFGCQWSGFAAMELAGARGLKYPANTRVIELPCSARLDPLHVLYALYAGADRVVLALCPPDECHFGNGNRYAEARLENLRALLASRGIDPNRLRVARMMGDDARAWVRAVNESMPDERKGRHP
jgi:heterodisulfide reductase subunit A